eukprot:TRINITY_DN12635_c0_g1_i1.p1 TRINITY_DN12635_c0_g1~~TRINITY_DN12635_c0_g1_i1.p1  ORF type:complete len:103 (+),score=7.61 TRINITY_DN12635_c0_g1_i1:287-595(+)
MILKKIKECNRIHNKEHLYLNRVPLLENVLHVKGWILKTQSLIDRELLPPMIILLTVVLDKHILENLFTSRFADLVFFLLLNPLPSHLNSSVIDSFHSHFSG